MKTGGKQNDVNRNTFALKVGAILADLRKENGLTQKEFGEIFNISESAVSLRSSLSSGFGKSAPCG